MRRYATILGLALLVLPNAAFGVAPAEPVGHWLIEDGSFAIEVHPCGDGFCGRIAWASPDPTTGEPPLDLQNRRNEHRARSLLGLDVVAGLQIGDKSGEWREGSFYDPRDGKTYYRATARLTDDGGIVLTGYADVKHRGRMVRSRFSHTVRFAATTPEALAAR